MANEATYAPQALLDTRHYLQGQTGLPANALGITGDDDHDGGYHCGWDNRDSDGTDYSWDESSRDWSHKTNAASALDIGWFTRLIELSVWLVEQCQMGAPDTLDIREIIYTDDGVTVKRWDRLGVRTSGNNSHLSHTHIGWFRDAEHRSKVELFQRFFEGTDMLTPREQALVSNAYQIMYEWTNEHDPIKYIIDLDSGAHIELPNLPLRRAKRIEEKLDQLLAAGGVDAAMVRHVVDEELDEAFRGGADSGV